MSVIEIPGVYQGQNHCSLNLLAKSRSIHRVTIDVIRKAISSQPLLLRNSSLKLDKHNSFA